MYQEWEKDKKYMRNLLNLKSHHVKGLSSITFDGRYVSLRRIYTLLKVNTVNTEIKLKLAQIPCTSHSRRVQVKRWRGEHCWSEIVTLQPSSLILHQSFNLQVWMYHVWPVTKVCYISFRGYCLISLLLISTIVHRRSMYMHPSMIIFHLHFFIEHGPHHWFSISLSIYICSSHLSFEFFIPLPIWVNNIIIFYLVCLVKTGWK